MLALKTMKHTNAFAWWENKTERRPRPEANQLSIAQLVQGDRELLKVAFGSSATRPANAKRIQKLAAKKPANSGLGARRGQKKWRIRPNWLG
jgi:hypothetical protein